MLKFSQNNTCIVGVGYSMLVSLRFACYWI